LDNGHYGHREGSTIDQRGSKKKVKRQRKNRKISLRRPCTSCRRPSAVYKIVFVPA